VFGYVIGAKLVQEKVAGFNELVVAPEAVGLNRGPLRFGMLRDLGRGLGEDLGVDRNETDGTGNTDKPSSVFHISHHLASLTSSHGFIVDCDTGKQGANRDTFPTTHWGRRRTADRTIDRIRERIGRKAVEYGVAVGLERG